VAVRPSLSDVVGLTYTTAAEPIRTLATRPPCAYACRWPHGQSVTIVGQYMRVRLRDKRTFGVMNVALEEKLVASYTCFFGQTLFLKGTLRRRIALYFLVHLESIYYHIFFYSKIVPNCAQCAVAK